MARRRKEDRRAGSASRGMVRRLGRFSSRVRHRVVPDRERVPDRCNSSGAAVDVCSDAPAWAQRAERAADGGVIDVSRALSMSPSAPRINAQHVGHCSSDSAFDLDRSIDRFYTAALNLFPQGAHQVRTGPIRARPHRGDDQRQRPPRTAPRGVPSRPSTDRVSPVRPSRLTPYIRTAYVT